MPRWDDCRRDERRRLGADTESSPEALVEHINFGEGLLGVRLSLELPWVAPARCAGGVNAIDKLCEAPTPFPEYGMRGCNGDKEDSPGRRIPSECRMRRFAGLKMVDFEGERGRLAGLAMVGA